jgi:hypothetical protein
MALCASTQHAHAYRRRDPELSDLRRFVRDHLEEFLLWTEEHFEKPLPRYVQREMRRFVKCGRLEHGFTRWRCKRCGHNMLVAFSCATRICPSCCGRRMAQAGAHLVDNVLPDAPLRQWVLTVPFPLRMLLAKDAALLSSVIRILVRAMERSYAMRAQPLGIANPRTGMLTAPQRFGGSMNLHVHIHATCAVGRRAKRGGLSSKGRCIGLTLAIIAWGARHGRSAGTARRWHCRGELSYS